MDKARKITKRLSKHKQRRLDRDKASTHAAKLTKTTDPTIPVKQVNKFPTDSVTVSDAAPFLTEEK